MLCSGAQDKPIGKGNLLPPPPSLIILQQLHSSSQLKRLKHASQIICLGGNIPDAPTAGVDCSVHSAQQRSARDCVRLLACLVRSIGNVRVMSKFRFWSPIKIYAVEM